MHDGHTSAIHLLIYSRKLGRFLSSSTSSLQHHLDSQSIQALVAGRYKPARTLDSYSVYLLHRQSLSDYSDEM